MRYSFEFKMKCVELYRKGTWVETTENVMQESFRRKILNWDKIEKIHRMLNKAFKKSPEVNGLILHSDQGWQYQHAFYKQSLKERGIIQSMSRKGNCYDNCIIETFFARMKNEMFYGFEKEYSTFKEFKTAVEEYIDYYNNKRIQEKNRMDAPCSIQGNIHVFSLN